MMNVLSEEYTESFRAFVPDRRTALRRAAYLLTGEAVWRRIWFRPRC